MNCVGEVRKSVCPLYGKPTPKDITPEEVIYLAERLGFKVYPGGKHPIKIINTQTQEVFPVPVKNGVVHWVYIAKLQNRFSEKEGAQKS